MNKEQIMNMSAGREMDALVAEKVMGWKEFKSDHGAGIRINFATDPSDGKYKPFPEYSSDISAAMEVSEKLMNEGWSFSSTNWGNGSPYVVTFGFEDGPYQCTAQTYPEAVCKAALLTLMEG